MAALCAASGLGVRSFRLAASLGSAGFGAAAALPGFASLGFASALAGAGGRLPRRARARLGRFLGLGCFGAASPGVASALTGAGGAWVALASAGLGAGLASAGSLLRLRIGGLGIGGRAFTASAAVGFAASAAVLLRGFSAAGSGLFGAEGACAALSSPAMACIPGILRDSRTPKSNKVAVFFNRYIAAEISALTRFFLQPELVTLLCP